MTAVTEREGMDRALEVGANEVVGKPIDEPTLLGLIERLLSA